VKILGARSAEMLRVGRKSCAGRCRSAATKKLNSRRSTAPRPSIEGNE
jgi:hypothetical protein